MIFLGDEGYFPSFYQFMGSGSRPGRPRPGDLQDHDHIDHQ